METCNSRSAHEKKLKHALQREQPAHKIKRCRFPYVAFPRQTAHLSNQIGHISYQTGRSAKQLRARNNALSEENLVWLSLNF